MSDLIERLRERLKLKYMGSCKCGNCQLVLDSDIAEAAAELERLGAANAALQRLADDRYQVQSEQQAVLQKTLSENAALRAERDAASGAFAVLLNYAQDSDDSCYGTLGTQLVREIIAQTGFRIDSARAKESGDGPQ